MKKLLFLLLPVLFSFITKAQEFVLVRDGHPIAVIDKISFTDSTLQVEAMFNDYIEKITGTKLTYAGRLGGYHVSFRLLDNTLENDGGKWTENPLFAKFRNVRSKETIKDAFYIRASHGFLSFTAATTRGLENAVYSFLEKYCGLRYYAHDAVVIPHASTLTVPFNIDWFEAPAFSFRLPYYYEATFSDYIDWHKLSSEPREEGNTSWPVSKQWGLWVHTLHRLLPPEQYFETHPEYYALRNGNRTTDQVCLSNKEVLEIVYRNLRKETEANPSARYWSVSQMDNYNYCECPECRKIDSIEGSHTGSMIRFINSLAERFPDKVISTLAYQYTRSAPKISKPLPNVNIMLCTIECDRNRPIAADTSKGSFYQDLKAWSALTDNILIWDYVINFSHLLTPFPNLEILDDNLRMFHEAGVSMVFEQGLRGCSGGEMNELRSYLLSKLLWNPYLDTDSLITDFVTGYYGQAAAPYILQYLKKSDSELKRSGKALTLYEPPATHSAGYLSPENLSYYFDLFNKALKESAGDSIKLRRINMAMQSLRYAQLEVAKSLPFSEDWLFTNEKPHKVKEEYVKMLNDLTALATQNGPSLYHEIRLTPEEYRQSMMNYFNTGVVNHLAVGKKITYNELPDPKYSASGLATLIDGVKGTGAYQMLWQGWWGKDCEVIIDLGEAQSINQVTVGYLDDNQSWIIAPRSMDVFVSEDGINYSDACNVLNPEAGFQLSSHTGKLTANPEKQTGRFVKVKVNNFGTLPAWRGVNADSWIFIDEIEIN